jgi:hypothetical protein
MVVLIGEPRVAGGLCRRLSRSTDIVRPRRHDLASELLPESNQAARTAVRNFATSVSSRPESVESDCAADNTCDDAEPVSVAPRCTSVMLDETCWVPCAACCTLRAISWVAAAKSLSGDSNRLKLEVGKFLSSVRAA